MSRTVCFSSHFLKIGASNGNKGWIFLISREVTDRPGTHMMLENSGKVNLKWNLGD